MGITIITMIINPRTGFKDIGRNEPPDRFVHRMNLLFVTPFPTLLSTSTPLLFFPFFSQSGSLVALSRQKGRENKCRINGGGATIIGEGRRKGAHDPWPSSINVNRLIFAWWRVQNGETKVLIVTRFPRAPPSPLATLLSPRDRESSFESRRFVANSRQRASRRPPLILSRDGNTVFREATRAKKVSWIGLKRQARIWSRREWNRRWNCSSEFSGGFCNRINGWWFLFGV